jgi:hypothetical protein
MSSGEPWVRCCSRFMLSMKSLRKRYYCQPINLPSDFAEFLSNSICSFLQQEDGPEPKNDDGSNFQFLLVAPVVLFGKNAPPCSKGIMRIQPSTAKLTPKQKQSSAAVATQARTQENSEGSWAIFYQSRSSDCWPDLDHPSHS